MTNTESKQVIIKQILRYSETKNVSLFKANFRPNYNYVASFQQVVSTNKFKKQSIAQTFISKHCYFFSFYWFQFLRLTTHKATIKLNTNQLITLLTIVFYKELARHFFTRANITLLGEAKMIYIAYYFFIRETQDEYELSRMLNAFDVGV